MATFVELTEEDSALYLVRIINDLVSPPSVEEKQTASEEESKADSKEPEEEVDPALKRAKESPLGKLVEKRDYIALLTGPGGLFENMAKLQTADLEVFEAGYSLGFSVLQKYEVVRAEAQQKRQEEKETAFKAEKKKKKKSEQDMAEPRDAWAKSEAERAAKEDQTRDSIISTFVKYLTDDEKSNSRFVRLQLLAFLFNFLGESSSMRHPIFLAILKYARAADQVSLVDGQLEHLSSWLPQWKLSPTQLAELYDIVAEIAPEDKQQAYILEFLKHVEECKVGERSAHVKKIAAKACVSALKKYQNSEQPQYDCALLLNYNPVQELAQDPAYAPLLELVKIFATRTITEYVPFQKVPANAKCLADHGLSHEDNTQTIRILTLCSLGLEREELTYAELKKKLMVDDSFELESVVIEAVMSNRLQAKIDQDKETVLIQRATARVFEDKDWEGLGTKLAEWGTKVSHVLANLRNIPERSLTST
jgi:translation initiation factor 3 subunit M